MQFEIGEIIEGKITGITKFGAFVELPDGKTGMVHISEVASTFVKEIRDYVKESQIVKVKVLSISEEGKISLSMKKAEPVSEKKPYPVRVENYVWSPKKNDSLSFEDMMNKFKQTSDEKLSDLKKYTDPKRGSTPKRPVTK
jgi:S1 RNA binding domain protein